MKEKNVFVTQVGALGNLRPEAVTWVCLMVIYKFTIALSSIVGSNMVFP